MNVHDYYDLEELAMLNGIEPQQARFRIPPTIHNRWMVQLGQAQAEVFVPTLDIMTSEEAATAAEKPGPVGTTPGSVPVRPERWNFETDPPTYMLASGDTFVGLSKTYLRDPEGTRWREIWDFQTSEFRSARTPDKVFVGDIVRMPPEAVDNMKAFLALGQPAGQKPGELTQAQKTKAKAKKGVKFALIGGGAAAAAYLLYKAFV